MAKLKKLVVKITADPPIGGEYDLEPRGAFFFTNREFHLIKTETGIRPAEVDDAATNGDTDVFVGFALVALQRAGFDNPQVRKIVWDLSPDAFDVEQITEEDPEEATLPPEKPLGELV
jgi:hypothetical protein